MVVVLGDRLARPVLVRRADLELLVAAPELHAAQHAERRAGRRGRTGVGLLTRQRASTLRRRRPPPCGGASSARLRPDLGAVRLLWRPAWSSRWSCRLLALEGLPHLRLQVVVARLPSAIVPPGVGRARSTLTIARAPSPRRPHWRPDGPPVTRERARAGAACRACSRTATRLAPPPAAGHGPGASGNAPRGPRTSPVPAPPPARPRCPDIRRTAPRDGCRHRQQVGQLADDVVPTRLQLVDHGPRPGGHPRVQLLGHHDLLRVARPEDLLGHEVLQEPLGGLGDPGLGELEVHPPEGLDLDKTERLVGTRRPLGHAGAVDAEDVTGPVPEEGARAARGREHDEVHPVVGDPLAPPPEHAGDVLDPPEVDRLRGLDHRQELVEGLPSAVLGALLPLGRDLAQQVAGREYDVHLVGHLVEAAQRVGSPVGAGRTEQLVADQYVAGELPRHIENALPGTRACSRDVLQLLWPAHGARRPVVLVDTASREEQALVEQRCPVGPPDGLEEGRPRLRGPDVQEQSSRH